MAIIQQTNAVFYHPLDNLVESLNAIVWNGGVDFQSARVSLGMKPRPADVIDSFGNEATFSGSGTSEIFIAILSPTTFVAVHIDGAPQSKAIIGTVQGTSITFGLPTVFNAGPSNTVNVSTIALSPTSFVIVYGDLEAPTSAFFGTAIVGTVTGTSIAFGAESVFNSAVSTFISTTLLTPTTFVVAYRDGGNGGFGTAIVGTVTGTSIAFGAESVFNSANINHTSSVTLTPTTFVVAYRDEGTGFVGTAIVGTVTGTAIAFGGKAVFNNASSDRISAVSLSPTTFVVTYRDLGNLNSGTAIVGTVTGTSIAFGAESVFNTSTDTSGISTTALSPTIFVVSYKSPNDGRAKVGTILGTDIVFGAETVFRGGSGGPTAIAAISSTTLVVAYHGDFSSGVAKVGSLSTAASILTASTPVVYATAVGATRLAFAAWTRSLGTPSFSGPPPQFFEETDRNMMIAMGMPASRLGGFT